MSTFNLRMTSRLTRPAVGKFFDEVSLAGIVPPVKMYEEQESIVEDEEVDPAVAAKRRRRRAQKRTELIMRDSATAEDKRASGNASFDYVGTVTDVNLYEEPPKGRKGLMSSSSSSSSAAAKDADLFKYVVLELVQRAAPGGGTVTEVSVAPVGEWVTFKRPCASADISLDAVDEAYRNRERGTQQGGSVPGGGAVDDSMRAPSLLTKGMRGGKAEREALVRELQATGVEGDEDDAPPRFEANGEDDGRNGGGPVHIDEEADRGVGVHDVGGEAGADYELQFDNDEDGGGEFGEEQAARDEQDEVFEAARTELYEDPDAEDSGSEGSGSDSEFEEDDDEATGVAGERAKAGLAAGAHSSAAEAAGVFGHVTKMEHERRERLRAQQLASAEAAKARTNGPPAAAGGAIKRPRDSSSPEAGSLSKRGKPDGIAGSGTPSPVTATAAGGFGGDRFELSESGVRSAITYMGGRVPLKELALKFRRQVSSKADKERFLGIIRRVTLTEEDPLLGKVVALNTRR